jgi:hypothetical protein
MDNNIANASGSSLLFIGMIVAGIELTVDNESLLTAQVDGGMIRRDSDLVVRLAQSHGTPGRLHQKILLWGKRVGWEPGIYVDCDPENPYRTGLDVMLITNNDNEMLSHG